MGKCFSYLLYCCGKPDNASQYGESGDRAQLIDPICDSAGIPRQSEHYYCPYNNDSAYAKKTEEHSDLNKILDEMAASVIDVGTLGSHSLEQHESRERSSFYFNKMRSLNAAKSLYKLPKQCLLVDLPNADRVISANCIVSESELQNMLFICDNIDKLIDDMKIGSQGEDLIIPFQLLT